MKALAVLVVALAVLALGTTLSSAEQSNSDRLTFVGSARGVAGQIFTANPDGSGVKQLTDDGRYHHTSPTWSPDGQYILFRRSVPFDFPFPEAVTGIFVVDADGQGLKQISSGNDRYPSWSPLGDRVTFMSYVQNSGFTTPDIFVSDPNSGQPINVTQHDSSDELPVWSPDGKEVVFVRRDAIMLENGTYEDIYDVLTVNPSTRQTRSITLEPLGYIGWVRWSPDGSEIMYAGGVDPSESHIYYAEADGSSTIRIDGTYRFPEYSPDGTKIAFMGVGGLHVMNHDGSRGQRMTPTNDRVASFTWSPDSSQLLYTTDDDLFVVQLETGIERQIRTTVRSVNDVDWYDSTSPRKNQASDPLAGSIDDWHVSLFVGIGLLATAALAVVFLRLRRDRVH